VLPVKHALDLQSNIAALLAIMFITDKPFLYATTIDHVTDIITARASHEECSEEGLSVLTSMGQYGNGICIAASIGSRTMVSCSLLSIDITADQIESSRLDHRPSMDSRPSLPHGCCDRLAIWMRSQASMRCLLWEPFETRGPGLQDTSGLSGPMMSVRLRDRLSVSVYAVRRGIYLLRLNIYRTRRGE
jgi:hypothetical protein